MTTKLAITTFLSFFVVLGPTFAGSSSKNLPKRPKEPVSLLIMFKSKEGRKKVLSQDNPKFPLVGVSTMGDRMAKLELDGRHSYLKFKNWMEEHPEVVLVEKNSNIKMMVTPKKKPLVQPEISR